MRGALMQSHLAAVVKQVVWGNMHMQHSVGSGNGCLQVEEQAAIDN